MEITKWEYKEVKFDEVHKLGKQGWEGFGSTRDGNGITHVQMKRPCGRLQVVEKVNGVPINQEQDRSDGIER